MAKYILAMSDVLFFKSELQSKPGKNLGPTTGNELRSLEINTLEKLKALGWEKVFLRWIELYPYRLKLVVACVLIGAVEDYKYYEIDAELKDDFK